MKLKSIKKHKNGSETFEIILTKKEEKLFKQSAKILGKQYSKKFIRESILNAIDYMITHYDKNGREI